jgi:transcriptional regulator with XRE-family HTH domain
MRRLLAEHDIAGVYLLLHRHGVSQRTLAARTGQAQSEVSEIMSGHREVHAYELLVRIAEGLGVPRGWMGLAFDESSEPYAAIDDEP